MAQPGLGTGPNGRGAPDESGEQHIDHYIVCGCNTLAHRLVVELTEQYGVPVIAIVPSPELDNAPEIVEVLGESAVVIASTITKEALVSAGTSNARGIALVDGDDESNVQAALRAQSLNDDIRIVLRMYDARLGYYFERLLKNCSVLSRSAAAAPAFVNAALKRRNSVQVGSHTLTVEVSADAEPEDFLCMVADRIDTNDITRMRMLPDSPNPDARIGTTERQQVVGPGSRAVLRFSDSELSFARAFQPLRRLIDMGQFFTARVRKVLAVAVAVVIGSFLLIWALGRPFGWAAYETLLDLAGSAVPDTYGQPSGTGGGWQRLAQVAITLCGIPLMAVVTAILVEDAASARRGKRDHIVVFGLGNVGTRVATQIHNLGIPVICIERDITAPGILAVGALGIPVLAGEAPLEAHLRQARVRTSRAVIALTSDDLANLQACLEARAIAPDVRLVLRLFNDDLATMVYQSFTNAASRSASYLAAPAFAAALMGREVLGTLSVYRQVVLIAEFVAEQGSDLVGRTLRDIDVPGEVRVIAVRTPHARDYLWRPDHGRHIGPGDKYVVLTTRTGLGRHTSRIS